MNEVPKRGRGRPKKEPVAPPPELAEAVRNATNADSLIAALKAGARGALLTPGTAGYVPPVVAKVLLDYARETRQVQMRLKAKEGTQGLLAGVVEILTKQEREAVEAYRASKRVVPLKPGETPPPPPEEPKEESESG